MSALLAADSQRSLMFPRGVLLAYLTRNAAGGHEVIAVIRANGGRNQHRTGVPARRVANPAPGRGKSGRRRAQINALCMRAKARLDLQTDAQ